MATVLPVFNHEESLRRVQHPLHILRKYIRRYVVLEGLALTILAMAVLFWVGLALDFGLYKFQIDEIDFWGNTLVLNYPGIDWIQELNDIDPTGNSSLACRVMILAVCVIGLFYLGISKVVVRWVREFNDHALAMVLERRFPRQLGDRLITAVELADPKLVRRYGFSQLMIEKTISDAVTTVDRLPVADVFNWKRLRRLWVLVVLATLGVWLSLMAVVCAGSQLADKPIEPEVFCWRFYDVASIWTERNVMMMNTYWPRRAYLQVVRFQPSLEDPNEMRVARDDDRPDLQVRAVEWVVADRGAPQGWRALKWSDLPRFVDRALVDSVDIPRDFGEWKVDPDELEPNLVAALFGTETQAKPIKAMRAHLQQAHVQKKIADRGAQPALDEWLDWTQWSVDKIAQQKEDPDVRLVLRGQAGAKDYYTKFDAIFSVLQAQVDSPSMSRTLRKLDIPNRIVVTFRGEESGSQAPYEHGEDNKFTVPLRDLKDSTRFRFRARGEDFYTSPKYIVLVAAPTPATISIDKEEPAYIYHRLPGEDQAPLKGKMHITRNFALSTTGETNTIEVPLGSNLVINVRLSAAAQTVTLGSGFQAGDTFALAYSNGIQSGTTEPIVYTGKEGTDANLQAALTKLLKTFPTLAGSSVSVTSASKNAFTVSVSGPAAINMEKLKPENIVSAAGTIATEQLKKTRLRREKSVYSKEAPILEAGFAGFPGTIEVDRDAVGFSLHMTKLTRRHDFVIEFFDEDNIRGKRRFKILSVIDTEPQLGNLNVFNVNLYPPKKSKDSEPALAGELAEFAGAFLITPDALIPFECMVKDDYGLVRVGYQYKSRTVDFELTPHGAKRPAMPEFTAARKLYLGAALSLFHFGPGNPLSWRVGPEYAAAISGIVQSDIKRSQGYKEAYVPSEGFKALVASRSGKMIALANLQEALTKPSVVQPSEFDFKEDQGATGTGFDVQRLLPEYKVIDPTRVGQLHYLLQISVQASDNNVETGAKYRDERDKVLLGNTKKNKNGYLSFLVVSENELLLRIAQEEAPLLEKLTIAKDIADAGRTRLEEQQSRMLGDNDKNLDMDIVLNRMNEVRTSLLTAGTNLREAAQVYSNILKVMEVNRVRADRLAKIRDKIIYPLKDIVEENAGSYVKANDAFLDAHQLVEQDVGGRRAPNVGQHREKMALASRNLKKLSDDIGHVLDAMTEEVDESKTTRLLVETLEEEQRNTRRLGEEYRRRVLEDLERLLEGDKKK